jgi:ABC-type spermidine/putrescine transport system permease subunit I
MLIMFVHSFWRVERFRIIQGFTLHNYYEIFTSPLLLQAFWLSLRIAVATVIVSAMIAYPFAYFLAKRAGRYKMLGIVAVVIPFWTSFILRSYAWKLLLGNQGILNSTLLLWGLRQEPITALLYSPTATAIGLIYVFLPMMILPLFTSLERIDDSLLQAAADLGAPPWRAFWEVTFPLALPGLAVGSVFTFIFALGEFIVPRLLGGGKNLLISQAIVLEFETKADWAKGSAMAMVLMFITLLLLGITASRVKLERIF